MIDPEPDNIAFKPAWPEFADVLGQGHYRFMYDALSDSLFISFYDPIGPAASVPVDQGAMDYVFLRVNLKTQEVVGFQVEHYLSYAVAQVPDLIQTLGLAKLHGNAPEEVAEITLRIQPEYPKPADAAAVLGDLVKMVA